MSRMRALLPSAGSSGNSPSVDLHTHYGAQWLETGGIRANMISSVDGAAWVAGRSAGLQVPADNLVFATLRDLADVVLVGAATAATENYGPARADARLRARLGLGPELPVAVVTRSLQVDVSARLFAGSRPLLITCAGSDPGRRAALAAHADVLVCGDGDIDFALVRRALAERALTRVLCEGGPRLLARVLECGQLDELCLTVSPLAAGAGAGRIVADATAGQVSAAPADARPGGRPPRPLHLTGLLEDDGALFLRYTVG